MIRINLTFDHNFGLGIYPAYGRPVELCYDGLRQYWELSQFPVPVTLELLSRPTKDTIPMWLEDEHVVVKSKLYSMTYLTQNARRRLTKLGVKKGVTYHVRCMV